MGDGRFVPTLGIIDYGLGNIGSVQNMLSYLNIPSVRIYSADDFDKADKVILPGVGAFDTAVSLLEKKKLWSRIRQWAEEEKPLLGICLGMQLLAEGSEEGKRGGLGLIPGQVRRFHFEQSCSLKVPHMGWTAVHATGKALFTGLESSRFYFVHSYYLECADPSDQWAWATYGIPFTAACGRGNVCGVQFHPEKSHVYGMKLLQNFAGVPHAAS